MKDLTTSQAVQLIRGPEGSEIKLYIQRIPKNKEKEEEFRVSITREKINLPSVIITTVTREGKNIVIVEISSISEYTTKLFMEEITPLISQGVGGIILDLRGNS
ncbi:MAG: hypothetical protein LBI53_07455 [Candidatus Peribacteria bacterium]|nr:hypothetical protein [Candidatus Peribacteria bacterium]